MSDYIMHSSGTWKNHKWIRREGSPGNYKYYYKSSDSDSSGSSKKYTDDPDYNPSTPYTNQYKDKNGKKHGTSTGSGTADTVRDTAYGTAGKSNYYGNKKLDSKKRARDIADLKRRAMGEAYRNIEVNKMIDGMAGRNAVNFIGGRKKKTLADISAEQQKKGKEIRRDQVNRMIDAMSGKIPTLPFTDISKVSVDPETGKGVRTFIHWPRKYNGQKKYQQQQETARRVREEQSSKEIGKEVKFVGGYRGRYEGKKAHQEIKNKQSKYYSRYAR